jgi:pimeloyl-ACP methyl ester carboxylesterase
MRDPAFGASYLARWQRALPGARVVELPDAGHFVQEEAATELATQVTTFLRRTAPRAGGDAA